MRNPKSYCLAILFAAWGIAYADVGHRHGSGIGTVGDVTDATRTIQIEMTDNRYDQMQINVRKDEVVRFIIHNRGQLVHEFNIGTQDMHIEHQDEMLAMMRSGQMTPTGIMHGHGKTMTHDGPNSILLNPGETRELVWRFSETIAGLEFACNVPGHYEAGMVGRFHVEDA